jgi:hypothetical protein
LFYWFIPFRQQPGKFVQDHTGQVQTAEQAMIRTEASDTVTIHVPLLFGQYVILDIILRDDLTR